MVTCEGDPSSLNFEYLEVEATIVDEQSLRDNLSCIWYNLEYIGISTLGRTGKTGRTGRRWRLWNSLVWTGRPSLAQSSKERPKCLSRLASVSTVESPITWMVFQQWLMSSMIWQISSRSFSWRSTAWSIFWTSFFNILSLCSIFDSLEFFANLNILYVYLSFFLKERFSFMLLSKFSWSSLTSGITSISIE